MSERVIEVVGLEKAYRFFRLASVSLELEAGQIMGFVGPNGAGKSTLMRILMGMIRYDHGAVRVLGQPIPEEQASAKRDVGFVSEDMLLGTGLASDRTGWHATVITAGNVSVNFLIPWLLSHPSVYRNRTGPVAVWTEDIVVVLVVEAIVAVTALGLGLYIRSRRTDFV